MNAPFLHRCFCALLLIFFQLPFQPAACAADANRIVRYPTLMADDDPLQEYVLAALDLGLRHSGKDYQRVASSAKMQQARAIQELLSDQGQLDLLWTMTTAEREAQLLAVKIPIDKGLFGWRIALVKRGRGNIFKAVRKSTDLQAYSAGQEHDWPDTPILRSNGLPVVTATSYEALFNMLDGKRFDYFPRSVMEIWQEYRDHPFHNLEVEKTIVLHYPTALYFFVSPRRPELAKDLHAGLEKAVADGSFERLFRKHLLPAIKKANIQKRRVLELSNPLLGPDSLPGKRSELWYKP